MIVDSFLDGRHKSILSIDLFDGSGNIYVCSFCNKDQANYAHALVISINATKIMLLSL